MKRAAALLVPLLLAGLPAAAQAPATIRVATVPFEAGAEPYYAAAMGFFAKAGLNVEITPISSGAAIAAAVAGGAADVGFSNIVSLATAHERGVAIVLLAPASLYVSSEPQTALIVAKSSPITSAKDLTGKVVAINGLQSIPEIGADAWIDRNGGDAASVHYVEMTNTAIGEAVASGRIDAGVLTEPDLSDWLGKNTRVLGHIYDAIDTQFVLSAWFATTAWANAHPDLAKRYAQAMAQTARWANAHHAASAKILEAETKIMLGPSAKRVAYGAELDPHGIQASIDAAARYHVLKASFPAADLLWSGGPS